MNRNTLVTVAAALAAVGIAVGILLALQPDAGPPSPAALRTGVLALPDPVRDSGTSVEEALYRRRSVRSYREEPLTLGEVAQLLWAAQGVTDPALGRRTAPSAGALYPLETYLVAGDVQGLPDGIYRYRPQEHALEMVADGDRREELYRASVSQEAVRDAPAAIVLSGVYDRTTVKYGERGIRYVHMEAGHAAENVYLQAESLGIGTVTIGAFFDGEVVRLLRMEEGENPLYVMPIGRR
ncbi:MAG: SagB/ThcOx family dehydrogenase [Methanomicrobiales archaeon]|nr:SagB/ThcOx family dehydrogenase [Methanomicrobiales archaeon]MDI6876148.1 SagB/ThcOx family dehydrogenase [Methanomicrobiales archaeon]